jgi:hypothetical protein
VNLGLAIALIGVFYLVGCSSPETKRTRGGGPGADRGNRDKAVRMHEGAKPFEKTPKLIPTKHPPLEPASQADQLSRQ